MPRLDVHSQLRAEIAPLGLEVRVVDFSYGGFRAECAAPFGPDSTYDFRIWTADGGCVETLRAKAVYCHRSGVPGQTPSYSTGFAFLDLRNSDTEDRVHRILDRITEVLQVA